MMQGLLPDSLPLYREALAVAGRTATDPFFRPAGDMGI